MTTRNTPTPELTLDPADWDSFRQLAHQMVDDMVEHLRTLRDQPAWQPMSSDVRQHLREPLPREGQGAEATYQQFLDYVLPYANGNRHPRFFGWVQGNGTPLGMMADMLAAGMNPHMAGFDQAPALVESQVLAWLTQLVGFPESASGLLVLGGTMANVLGLAVARHAKAGFDVREHGLQREGPRLVVYASTETHGWATKSAELLGLGRRSLRLLPVDASFRMDLGALREAIAADRRAGHHPLCVIGTAGTVNTGASDDLVGLAALCREEGLWFHVDGAFGALAAMSDKLRPGVRGLEQADSLAFDLHKWMYQPFDVACVLVRDAAVHRAAFASSASYLATLERGVISGGLPFADRGIDLTRGFRALKVWMALKAHGVGLLTQLIEQNVEQARYLAERVSAHPELELLAPVPLNIVCLRFKREGLDDGALNRVNQELLLRLQESGLAVPSSTVLAGRFALRCCFVNHRTRFEDIDALVEAVVRTGRRIAEEG
ncbi:pyridoxal phosphate-dependent decarboxylase family protein [Archangium sp.]|uniref:pyridoxal phosphate-dependent decarboxylase family protein n=1 Tax=Archangium sp. TaxID=1872627 RepID=UPI00389A718A